MRARMALAVSEQPHALREILLRDKPAEMIAVSPKASVPVLHFSDGMVLEESLDIMLWTLERNDPEGWLNPTQGDRAEMLALIEKSDGDFKHHLDRYKYPTRYDEGLDANHHREQGLLFLKELDRRLGDQEWLFGKRPSLADFAIFPFVRQFAHTDKEWFDAQNIPGVQNWLNVCLESDLFQRIMKKWPVWKHGDVEPDLPEAYTRPTS